MTEDHWPSSVLEAANTSDRKMIPSVAADTPRPQAGNAFARVLYQVVIRLAATNERLGCSDSLDGACGSTGPKPLSYIFAELLAHQSHAMDRKWADSGWVVHEPRNDLAIGSLISSKDSRLGCLRTLHARYRF